MKLLEFLDLYDFLKEGATVKDWGTDNGNNEIYIIDDKDNIYNFRLENRKEQGEQIEKLTQSEPQPSTKIFINSQLGDKKSAELNAQNFPRLFDGQKQVRNISIIETAQGLDIQTILTPLEIEQEITQFLRNKYQAK